MRQVTARSTRSPTASLPSPRSRVGAACRLHSILNKSTAEKCRMVLLAGQRVDVECKAREQEREKDAAPKGDGSRALRIDSRCGRVSGRGRSRPPSRPLPCEPKSTPRGELNVSPLRLGAAILAELWMLRWGSGLTDTLRYKSKPSMLPSWPSQSPSARRTRHSCDIGRRTPSRPSRASWRECRTRVPLPHQGRGFWSSR